MAQLEADLEVEMDTSRAELSAQARQLEAVAARVTHLVQVRTNRRDAKYKIDREVNLGAYK
jgi:hypothetical protein